MATQEQQRSRVGQTGKSLTKKQGKAKIAVFGVVHENGHHTVVPFVFIALKYTTVSPDCQVSNEIKQSRMKKYAGGIVR